MKAMWTHRRAFATPRAGWKRDHNESLSLRLGITNVPFVGEERAARKRFSTSKIGDDTWFSLYSRQYCRRPFGTVRRVRAMPKKGASVTGISDLRTQRRHRAIAFWLLAVAAMVFVMVVIGGLTRLTHSGCRWWNGSR